MLAYLHSFTVHCGNIMLAYLYRCTVLYIVNTTVRPFLNQNFILQLFNLEIAHFKDVRKLNP